MAFLEARSTTDAWLAASDVVVETGSSIGLHVRITEPQAQDQRVVRLLDATLKSLGKISCKHVSHTIFPEGLWRKIGHGDANRLIDLYNKAGGYYDRLRRHRVNSRHNDWGTYFQRLSSSRFGKGSESQLSLAIRALSRANLAGAVHLHTAFPADGIRRLGGPCLQLITMHAEHGDASTRLSACAIYRNHDFLEKALGNYIGLGQLLGFVANCSNLQIGELHVISGHAYCATKRPLREVIRAFGT